MADAARINENPRNPPKPTFCRPAGKPLQIAKNSFRAFEFSSSDLFRVSDLVFRIHSPLHLCRAYLTAFSQATGWQPLSKAKGMDDYKKRAKFDSCRGSSTIQPFYAKQTQFTKRTNGHKSINNNGLRENRYLVQWEKQTQIKPKQSQFQRAFFQ